MKKYFIVGTLFGFLLSLGASAHAEIVSMIGKVVEGSFPLLIDGKRSEKDVLVIDGTSYLPVKAAGEIFGYDVSFIDSQVILNRKKVDIEMDQATKDKIEQWEKRRQAAQQEKEELEQKLKDEQKAIETRRNEALEKWKKEMEELQQKIQRQLEARIKEDQLQQ